MAALKDLPSGLVTTMHEMVCESWDARTEPSVIWMARLLAIIGPKKAEWLGRHLLKKGTRLAALQAENLYYSQKRDSRKGSLCLSVRALFAYAKQAFPYTNYPKETVVRSSVMNPGCCDVSDVAVWLASHLLAIGISASFVLWQAKDQREFHHVYVQADIGKKALALDPHHSKSAGTQPKNPSARLVIPIEGWIA